MSSFLLVTREGGVHLQPMLLAAKGLLDAGHKALAISDAHNARDAATWGVPFQRWRKAPSRRDRGPKTDPPKDWLAKSLPNVVLQLVDGAMRRRAADRHRLRGAIGGERAYPFCRKHPRP